MSPKRPGTMSDADRALAGRRVQSAPRGVPIVELAAPHEVQDPATGVLQGEELAKARSRRPTEERVAHVEERLDEQAAKHDELAKSVAEWRVETAENFGSVRGAIGELTGAVKGLTLVVETAAKREHMTFTATVEVDKAKQLAQVEVDKAEKTAAVEVNQAEKKDTIDARKSKRDLRNKLIAAGLTGSGVAAVIIKALTHWGVL